MAKPIIALDGDGVLLDYHEAYATVWERVFGTRPALKDPLAYWPVDRWDVPQLEPAARKQLKACMDGTFWSSFPALPGARTACENLVAAGFDLVCVTAIRSDFREARFENLRRLGLPVSDVISAPLQSNTVGSPKARALADLNPVAFVDDYAVYLQGIPDDLHAALILREPNGSPNTSELSARANSLHADLPDFVAYWLARPETP